MDVAEDVELDVEVINNNGWANHRSHGEHSHRSNFCHFGQSHSATCLIKQTREDKFPLVSSALAFKDTGVMTHERRSNFIKVEILVGIIIRQRLLHSWVYCGRKNLQLDRTTLHHCLCFYHLLHKSSTDASPIMRRS
ncbi:hypothetical protein NE237_030424 [Protea cynaroides]|uniref:Uncharacterized protein n=1 Tax=Protea cynaroides TaxID=273540 RepID=A0A9Q0GX72_9MAGN|nr:hypothetical protein NE237_030424 [Protea cynaroides]